MHGTLGRRPALRQSVPSDATVRIATSRNLCPFLLAHACMHATCAPVTRGDKAARSVQLFRPSPVVPSPSHRCKSTHRSIAYLPRMRAGASSVRIQAPAATPAGFPYPLVQLLQPASQLFWSLPFVDACMHAVTLPLSLHSPATLQERTGGNNRLMSSAVHARRPGDGKSWPAGVARNHCTTHSLASAAVASCC